MSERSNFTLLPRPDLIGFAVLAVILLIVFPLAMDVFRLNLVGKYLTYAFVALGLVLCWGYGGILSLGQGLLHGDVPQARGLGSRGHQDPVDPWNSRFHGLEPVDRTALLLGAVS